MKKENAYVIKKAIDDSKEADDMIYAMEIAIRDRIEEAELEGKLKGQVYSILELLEEYGNIPDGLKNKLLAQHDTVQLSKWLKTASRVRSISEFEDMIGLNEMK